MPTTGATATVAVVGAGITGLAAAWELGALLGPEADVLVLEATDRVGGKLRTARVGGHSVDVGAESMLARRPEAVGLVAEAGLGDRLVHPTGVGASVWSRGRRRSLPGGTVMGVPVDPEDAAGILDQAEVARAAAEVVGPPVAGDVAVGEFVASRLGDAVADRLVEPLLAGVYAGHSRRLSLRACVPALWPAAAEGLPLLRRDRPQPASAEPVFAGYRGGLGALAGDFADLLVERGVRIRTGALVRAVEPTGYGDARWRLTLGSTVDPHHVHADAVVIAVPAAPTGRLLQPLAPAAAAELAAVEHASVAVVTYAIRRSSALAAATTGSSGFLVPPTEPATIKASTFSASKWAWVDALDPDVVHLRVSLGRAGEAGTLQNPDRDLATTGLQDLARVLDVDLDPADVLDRHVQRWGGGLPQYAVGHLDRVQRVRAAVAAVPRLAVAGATYDGVGIPACIGSGRVAAREVAATLTGTAGATPDGPAPGQPATIDR